MRSRGGAVGGVEREMEARKPCGRRLRSGLRDKAEKPKKRKKGKHERDRIEKIIKRAKKKKDSFRFFFICFSGCVLPYVVLLSVFFTRWVFCFQFFHLFFLSIFFLCFSFSFFSFAWFFGPIFPTRTVMPVVLFS